MCIRDRYWFVRIGVVLLLTGLGFLAYFKKQFFVDLAPEAKVASFYTLSFLLGGLGVWLQRKKETLKTWSVLLTAIAGLGLVQTLIFSKILPLKQEAKPAETAALVVQQN